MAKEIHNTCPIPVGKLLIIGGAENKGDNEARDKQTPGNFERLEVVTSASGEWQASFEDYRKVFEELSITTIGHIHHETRKDVLENQAVLDRIKVADAIFFAGGDQLKYTHKYGGTPFLTLLKERY